MAITEKVICPDTQIFASGIIFYDVEYNRLSRLTKKQKNCFSHMKDNNTIVIFKSHSEDFLHLLLSSFKTFLDHITKSIVYANTKNLPEREFYQHVQSRYLQGREISGGADEQFIDYWNCKKHLYYSWKWWYRQQIENKMSDLTIELWNKFVELKKYKFDLEENLVEDQLNYFLEKQKSGEISNRVQFRDLKILSSCIVYTRRYNPDNLVYFVTGDKSLERVSREQKSKLNVLNLEIFSLDQYLISIRE